MRRALTIIGILALIIAASIGLYRVTSRAKAAPAPDYEVLTVEKGTLISTVSATGAIEPQGEVSLIFRGAGRVGEVLVKEGEQVTRGQVLARLESGDLDLAEAQAEAGLAISKAQLAKLKAPADPLDIASAEASVASAQAAVESARAAVTSAEASYRDLQNGQSADQKAVAASNLERARAVLAQAQAAYDQVAQMPQVGMMPQALQLQQATIDYNTAEANYRLSTAAASASQLAGSRAQIAQAKATLAQTQATLAQAQATLEKLNRGPGENDLAIAEAQVKQGEIALQQAQLNRTNIELASPGDGVVTKVNIKPGELPSAAQPAMVVTDLSKFHITISVDEIDIGRLQEGQKVNITLDAVPDAKLTGHISSIAATPSSSSGAVTYQVTVVIDESDATLRSGLSATASIVTQELADVVLVPNRSIQIDRTSGRAYVEKIVNGVPARTEIELGARNEASSQVLSGLAAGDQLAIRSGTSLDRLRNTMFGN